MMNRYIAVWDNTQNTICIKYLGQGLGWSGDCSSSVRRQGLRMYVYIHIYIYMYLYIYI